MLHVGALPTYWLSLKPNIKKGMPEIRVFTKAFLGGKNSLYSFVQCSANVWSLSRCFYDGAFLLWYNDESAHVIDVRGQIQGTAYHAGRKRLKVGQLSSDIPLITPQLLLCLVS